MLGQRIGYIRMSTLDQHTERQLDGIEVDKTFLGKAAGKDTKWPKLELLMSFSKPGLTPPQFGIQYISQGVAEQVGTKYGATDKNARENGHPRGGFEIAHALE